MTTPKVIPHYSELVEYNYAVAGHDGTMCDTDGELFIKPCTQSEIDFYQSLQTEEHSRMAEIVPIFCGSLSLNDSADVSRMDVQLPLVAGQVNTEVKEQVLQFLEQEKEAVPPPPVDNVTWIPNANRKIPTNTAVCLENASQGFRRPNIMDVKLGRRLWADDAPLEKKRRFDKISAETTHHDLGFRIAGMRVYKGSDDATELDEEDYKIYDKDYGRNDVNKRNVVEAFRNFIYNTAAGIDDAYARAVAEAFRQDLENVRDVLEAEETRMYSSSLLFIFEGDGESLKSAIDERIRSTANALADKKPDDHLPGRTTCRIDSGIGLDDDGEFITGSDDGDDMDDEPRIWNLKLIDFAHAKWTPGQGPDENILLGVRSLIKIFEELSQ
ncbi:hypothetical protein N0V82_007139 [Gnomoniopsis sp. IMI 355080]|nr:hypothetical protein N0V82_007139 [Gnomoniopsis sp. IMI 355080]